LLSWLSITPLSVSMLPLGTTLLQPSQREEFDVTKTNVSSLNYLNFIVNEISHSLSAAHPQH